MLNEKIKYYRKKNMLTQEQLANDLHVSRQMITKWESGIVMPGLEYLIDLSQIFGVTIDTLVKDDDCQTIEEKDVDLYELNHFIIKAKRETYAGKKGKIPSCRKGSQDYFYKEGKYSYLDSFVGSSKFSGEEVVYEDENVIWSMNYYGRVIGDHFDGDFLKEALLRVSTKYPFRGPASYGKGDYHYYNDIHGDMDCFDGKESIFYQDIKIYECFYHGGKVI